MILACASRRDRGMCTTVTPGSSRVLRTQSCGNSTGAAGAGWLMGKRVRAVGHLTRSAASATLGGGTGGGQCVHCVDLYERIPLQPLQIPKSHPLKALAPRLALLGITVFSGEMLGKVSRAGRLVARAQWALDESCCMLCGVWVGR